MQKLTELVVCFIVMLAVSIQESAEFGENLSAFIDPLDFPKKTCPYGLVADIDYAIITGFINVTHVGHPPLEAKISVLYICWRGFVTIPGSITDLRTAGCAQAQQLPPNSCRCLEQDGKFLRVKCNITIIRDFTFTNFILGYHSDRDYSADLPVVYGYHSDRGLFSDFSADLPVVYGDTLCGKRRTCACSSNQGSSLLGGGYAISGIVIIITALVFTVSSQLSHGQ